ncbi:hypothetical protein GCM10010252_31580 [Streptomyces aureoverticillatus]|nr:hypothetical protein GCM10010252_31580 [Streptomyces aureoverticillatus]
MERPRRNHWIQPVGKGSGVFSPPERDRTKLTQDGVLCRQQKTKDCIGGAKSREGPAYCGTRGRTPRRPTGGTGALKNDLRTAAGGEANRVTTIDQKKRSATM